jgi:VanZ family protein
MSTRSDRGFAIRRWALLLYWAAMFTATHWPDVNRYRPRGGWPIPAFGTVMHVGIYVGWAVVWWWVLSAGGRRVSRGAVNWLVLSGALYAAFDELTQDLVGRTPGLADFVSDIAGVVVATVILQIWQRTRTTPT